jgi:hypothetical protein
MNPTAHADRPAIGTSVAGERHHHRPPTRLERLARFVCRSHWNDLSEPACDQPKLRALDSLRVAFGALDGAPVALVREHVREFGGAPLATLRGPAVRLAIDLPLRCLDAGVRGGIRGSESVWGRAVTYPPGWVAMALEVGAKRAYDPAEDGDDAASLLRDG